VWAGVIGVLGEHHGEHAQDRADVPLVHDLGTEPVPLELDAVDLLEAWPMNGEEVFIAREPARLTLGVRAAEALLRRFALPEFRLRAASMPYRARTTRRYAAQGG